MPSFGCGYKKIFVCHVTLQDLVVEVKNDFMVRSLSKYVTILPSLVAIGTLVVENYWFLFATWLCETTRSERSATLWLGVLQDKSHPSKFRGHKHSCSRDIMVLACYLISQDYVIKKSYDFMGSSPSRCATILPSLEAIDTLLVEI